MRAAHNRAVLAARAGARPSTRTPGRAANDLTVRTLTVVKPSGAGIRRSKAKMTGAQRNSEGRRSEWNNSMTCKDRVATDAKWSQTVGSQNV